MSRLRSSEKLSISNSIACIWLSTFSAIDLYPRFRLYCVEWGVKLYSLTHTVQSYLKLVASYDAWSERMVMKNSRMHEKLWHVSLQQCITESDVVYSSGRFVKQEQWERWRANRKLVSGSKHRGRFCGSPGVLPPFKNWDCMKILQSSSFWPEKWFAMLSIMRS